MKNCIWFKATEMIEGEDNFGDEVFHLLTYGCGWEISHMLFEYEDYLDDGGFENEWELKLREIEEKLK